MQAGKLTADDIRRISSPQERRQAIIAAIFPDLRKLCRKGMLRGTAAQFDSIDDAAQEACLALCEYAGTYDPDYVSPRTGRPVKPLTMLLWPIRAYMQKQLTRGRRMPVVFAERAFGRLAAERDGRASEGDPAMVLGMPVQRELF